jgi:hypothetical protein
MTRKHRRRDQQDRKDWRTNDPMRAAYLRFVGWTLVTTTALYFEEGPIVLLPAIAVLALVWRHLRKL